MNIPIETKPVVPTPMRPWRSWGSVDAQIQVCVATFRRDAAFDANLAALKKFALWSQGDFVEKGG